MTTESNILTPKRSAGFASGKYWQERSDLLYYQYILTILRCVGVDAKSLLDVGSGNSPYIEWFDWIPKKASVDIVAPYSSPNVEAIKGNILNVKFPEVYDICTCFQVLEHVSDPGPFAKRLLELGKLLVVSVPFMWPEGKTTGHVQDPVSLADLEGWFGRPCNYHIIVKEPFREVKSERLIAIIDPSNASRKFGISVWDARRRVS